MRDACELWAGGPVFRQDPGARLSTDSVLLADFVPLRGAERGIDLGCGAGILSLLLLCRGEKLHMTGLELREEAAALARENLMQNGLGERSRILTGDLREHRSLFSHGSFDLAVANPPYFPTGSGASSPDPARAGAREERESSLEDFCAAAAFLLPTGGRFCLVYRPERLTALLGCLHESGLEPKRLRFVSQRAESAPSLVLAEGRRGGKPGLVIEPPLILTDAEGRESAEVRRIYHRENEE